MTILEVDEIIQKIVDMDLYEIEQIAAERFHINTAYLELEDVVEKLQECLMAEIEESDELLEYIKKEAATDGKYAGEIWDLLSYCKITQNIEYFITNSAKYGKENIPLQIYNKSHISFLPNSPMTLKKTLTPLILFESQY